jgi:hypothetical protein
MELKNFGKYFFKIRIKLVRCNSYLRSWGDKNIKLERDWRGT